jgi:chromosome segregation ATPase
MSYFNTMEEYEMCGPEEQKWLYRMALDELIEKDNRIAQINRDRDGFARQRDEYYAGMLMRKNERDDAKSRIVELEEKIAELESARTCLEKLRDDLSALHTTAERGRDHNAMLVDVAKTKIEGLDAKVKLLGDQLWLAAGFLMTTNARFQFLPPKDVLAKLERMLANLEKEKEQLTLAERVAKDDAAWRWTKDV